MVDVFCDKLLFMCFGVKVGVFHAVQKLLDKNALLRPLEEPEKLLLCHEPPTDQLTPQALLNQSRCCPLLVQPRSLITSYWICEIKLTISCKGLVATRVVFAMESFHRVGVVDLLKPSSVNTRKLALIKHVAVAITLAVLLMMELGFVTHRYESVVLFLQVKHVLVIGQQLGRLELVLFRAGLGDGLDFLEDSAWGWLAALGWHSPVSRLARLLR